MRCGGGQECKHCRKLHIGSHVDLKKKMIRTCKPKGKKFFSEDTLRNHEDACGSFDNYLETEARFKDEIVVEDSMLIKTEQIEMVPSRLNDQDQMELLHIKTEMEDFV
jgi:hypothetical protein